MRYFASTLWLVVWVAVASAQDFDINKFTDPAKYQWNTFELRQQAQQDLLFRQQLFQSYQEQRLNMTMSLGKSAMIPGWGHFTIGSYTKGQIFLGLEIISIGSSLYFYDQAMNSYNKYKDDHQIDAMNKHYDDALRPYRFSQAFLGAAIITWGYCLYDTYRETDKYNSRLWDNLSKEAQQRRLQVTPTGVSWRF